MKPDFATPNTLILALWVAANDALIVGSLLTADNDLVPDVIEQRGSPWPALAAALREAELVGPWLHLLLLCNDETFVRQLRGQVPPTPTAYVRHWLVYDADQRAQTGRKGEYIQVGWGGDPDQWECLTRLALWPCSWRALTVLEMPNVRMRWEQPRA